MLKKNWQIALALTPEADRSLQAYPPVLRQILYNRGYATPEAAATFLEARTPPGARTSTILGISEAVERIRFAIQHGEPIAVYGDYDADGVTATALLGQTLRAMGGQVLDYIPNRFDEGYGLNLEALKTLRGMDIRLVITVDCGIRSLLEADYSHQLGMDLIITDHHHPGPELPIIKAIINPKQPADTYPEKDLAGVGLAYKLAAALTTSMGNYPLSIERQLDLVTLGTVADLAPLVGENRALVRAGLEQIRNPSRQGLMALIGVSRLTPGRITAGDIGFVLGPRLNAAGRLDSALAALNLLTTSDVYEAARLAQQLENQNRDRQQITRTIQVHAEQLALAENPDALLLFAAHPDYNPGVVGLAASRLAEQYYRPAIVAQVGEEFTRGSCRSIPEFHITQALDQCADLLEHHGGHAAAAGFTIRNDLLPELVGRLQAIAQQHLANLDLRPRLYADLELPLSQLTPDLLVYLDWLQPTGYGNRPAYFVSRDLRVTNSRIIGKDNAHLKLVVSDGRITYDAIAFRQAHWIDRLPAHIDLLYSFELNEYNGRKQLQLNVRDLKPAGTID